MTDNIGQQLEQQNPQEELVAQYAVTPEEAQAWLTHLGYSTRDTWEAIDNEPGETIPLGSHHLRMIAHVACSDKPVLFEKLDSDRYAYGGGRWDVEELREDSKALKEWFKTWQPKDLTQAAGTEIVREISRQQVIDALHKYLEGLGPEEHIDFDLSPEVQEVLERWNEQEEDIVKRLGTPAAIHGARFSDLTLWFDAGLTSWDEDELAWSIEELEALERITKEEGLSELSQNIKNKLTEMTKLLSNLE